MNPVLWFFKKIPVGDKAIVVEIIAAVVGVVVFVVSFVVLEATVVADVVSVAAVVDVAVDGDDVVLPSAVTLVATVLGDVSIVVVVVVEGVLTFSFSIFAFVVSNVTIVCVAVVLAIDAVSAVFLVDEAPFVVNKTVTVFELFVDTFVLSATIVVAVVPFEVVLDCVVSASVASVDIDVVPELDVMLEVDVISVVDVAASSSNEREMIKNTVAVRRISMVGAFF